MLGLTGGFVRLEIHEPGLRPGLEHEPGASRTATAQDGGDRRLRREVGLCSEWGSAGRLENRFGLRLGRADHWHCSRGRSKRLQVMDPVLVLEDLKHSAKPVVIFVHSCIQFSGGTRELLVFYSLPQWWGSLTNKKTNLDAICVWIPSFRPRLFVCWIRCRIAWSDNRDAEVVDSPSTCWHVKWLRKHIGITTYKNIGSTSSKSTV